MKRKILDFIANNTRSKKRKIITQQPIWVAATHIYNYMKKDPIIDWLKLTKPRMKKIKYNQPPTLPPLTFTDFIKNRGILFESKLIDFINTSKISIKTVSTQLTDESCQKTRDLMMLGTPVIYSAPVRHSEQNIGGIIDLLVRSDYLDSIVRQSPLTETEKYIKAPFLKGNYHYVVIDIKFMTIPIHSGGKYILNSGSIPAYKAQTYIYTKAVGEIQGYESRYGFLLGRRCKQGKINNFSSLDKLGTIDFEEFDREYVSRTNKAIEWVRDVKTNGHKWVMNPPSKFELYPNMCVDSGIWNIQKKEIADQLGEITSIWNCGIKNREIGLVNNIMSWKDPNCTSCKLGINGRRSSIIDKIMKINRQNKILLRPKKIKSNIEIQNELFVDFETLSDIFSDFDHLPLQKSSDIIFMIGVGWFDKKWKYKSFCCKQPTHSEENRIMKSFLNFVKQRNNPKLYYWHAEQSMWNRATLRHRASTQLNWVDLCKIFKAESIVIKNCFNYGLKSISRAMYDHGMIQSSIESSCNSGMTAMINAWRCYKEESDPVNSATMKDIIIYNEFDCKVLWEIISYLRKNHY